MAINLTDHRVKSLRKPGKQEDNWDTLVPGLSARVSAKGQVTFTLRARYPGSRQVFHRAIGRALVLPDKTSYPASRPLEDLLGLPNTTLMTVEEARDVARSWLGSIGKGIDPAVDRKRQQALAERSRSNTFRSVVEHYNSAALVNQRKGATVYRELMREFVNDVVDEHTGKIVRQGIGHLPIAEVTMEDIRPVIAAATARGCHTQAHHLFGHVRSLFSWIVGSGSYGLTMSPCAQIRPSKLVGKKRQSRKRVLNDEEIKALWLASDELGYPAGQFYKLLLLTGQRLQEVAGAPWSEISEAKANWEIPAERMKMEFGHSVPLSPAALRVLKDLPRASKWEFLFSFTAGKKPINSFSAMKKALDAEMLRLMKRWAEERGEDPNDVVLKPFVNHDIRRTLRTRLSTLKVDRDTAERVIAHVPGGNEKVYNIHRYDEEKLDALTTWAEALHVIVYGTPDPEKRRKNIRRIRMRVKRRIPTASNVVSIAAGKRGA